jgi:phospholipid/cholesterol/gamma-HCH transport system substrate-binding protein
MKRRLAALALVASLVGTGCSAIGITAACDGTEIIGMFEQVGDLVPNANVQSSDVEIGSISTIELDGWEAKVTMCLDEGEKVPVDTELVIRTTSLLGEKFVDVQSQAEGPPYLEDGAIVGVENTSKATELEEVFAQLASILGTGNLEQLNRFTAAQANILRNRGGQLREVLSRLHQFTEVLNRRRTDIADSIDSLDSVARTVVGDGATLERFLKSFAGSTRVLENQKEELQSLLVALERFTSVSVQLLNSTEQSLDSQLRDLRPVLRTAVANSGNLRESLKTLATFTEWFPESMPGDYLQLDVCQAPPEYFGAGTTCAQNIDNDDPNAPRFPAGSGDDDAGSAGTYDNPIEYILRTGISEASR